MYKGSYVPNGSTCGDTLIKIWSKDGRQRSVWSYLLSSQVLLDMVIVPAHCQFSASRLETCCGYATCWSFTISLSLFMLCHDLTTSAMPQGRFIDLSAPVKPWDLPDGYSKDIHQVRSNQTACCSTHPIHSFYNWFIFLVIFFLMQNTCIHQTADFGVFLIANEFLAWGPHWGEINVICMWAMLSNTF
jgi:hypothetical protein